MTEHAVVVCAKAEHSTRYLSYVLASMNLGRLSAQSAQPGLSVRTLAKQIVSLPSLEIQEKIVAVISSLESKIEANNRINDNLDEVAMAIFQNWFIDYNPFSGTKPISWKSLPLGAVCRCELGGTPSRRKTEYWGGNIPWINSGEINKFRIIQPSEMITELGLKKSATKLLPAKTTAIAITGATLGQVSLLEIPSCANQSVIGIIPSDVMPYEYIYPLIRHQINALISHQTGGAQQHINKQNVEEHIVDVPNRDIMRDYKDKVTCIYAEIAARCFENEKLKALRDALLPKLMSGEIDVSQVRV